MITFDWINYFEISDVTSYLEIYTLFITISFVLLFEIFYILKMRRMFAKGGLSYFKTSYFLLTLSIFLWPLGSYIGVITRILTENSYQIFSSENNIFFAVGLLLSIVLFARYIASILHSPFFKQRESSWNNTFKILAIIAFISVTILLVRFILLGFFPPQFRGDTRAIIIIMTIVSTGISTLILILATIFLFKERRAVTSKLKKTQMTIYILFPLALSIAIVFAFLNQVWRFYFTSSLIFGNFIYLAGLLAILSLYYGMFTPKWFLIRMNVVTESDINK
jgi:hypothetical protein